MAILAMRRMVGGSIPDTSRIFHMRRIGSRSNVVMGVCIHPVG
ncbi:hypothetical protein C7S13_5834 [Burkholderia cepacia]|nr:hypothetical protein [Burkholderia cepacia]